MTKFSKITVVFLFVCAMVFTLCACQPAPCNHGGGTATCFEKAVCAYCGKEYGEVADHHFLDATCLAPQTCLNCGTTQSEAIGHNWVDATYTNPETCTLCGATQGEILEYVETLTHEGLKYQLNQDKTGYVVTGRTEERTQYEILSSAYFLPVVGIGNRAFYNCTSLTNINIPDSITSIGDSAFYRCKSLTNINIPDGVTAIGDYAFAYCDIISITIPNSVTAIGEDAFSCCFRLVEVYNFSSLEIVAGSSGHGRVAYYALGVYTSNVESKLWTDEKGFTFFEDDENCYLVNYNGTETHIVLPEISNGKDYIINTNAFRSCDTLISVKIPNNVIVIGEAAFHSCENLTNVELPENLQVLGWHSFAYCIKLQRICIPKNVTNIGNGAFHNCFRLVEVYNFSSLEIVAGSTDHGHAGFYALGVYTSNVESKLWTDENGFTFFEDGENCYLVSYDGTETEIVLPDSCNGKKYTIKTFAFYYCDTLTSVNFPDSITSISASAFEMCYALTSIDLPESITSIGNFAFSSCDSLISITIPDSVTSIGNFAFSNCDNLISVVLPDSLTSIGDNAFSDCCRLVEVYNFSSLEIEAGSTEHGEVGYYALAVYSENVKSKLWTDENGFTFFEDDENCYLAWYDGTATELVLPDSCNGKNYAIKSYAFYYCDTLTSITLSDGTTSIGNSAFSNCDNLISITIPDSVTSIGNNAFYSCDSLISITIPNSVTSIGYSAFYYCENLTSITIPEGVTSIGSSAFSGCDNLISIKIPDSVTSIGSRAFEGCTSLKSIDLPDGITSIGSYAFSNCQSLTNIVIPDSVTSIGNSVFYNCSNLTIYCQASSKPDGWQSNWNSSNRPVVWGYVPKSE